MGGLQLVNNYYIAKEKINQPYLGTLSFTFSNQYSYSCNEDEHGEKLPFYLHGAHLSWVLYDCSS